MHRIIISCKTLLKGGAEKQALILSGLLKIKGFDVTLINWFSGRIDPEYLRYIDDHSVKYVELEGSLIKKFIRFLKIIRDERISIVISYLTLSNFLSGITKIFIKEVVTIGGIRNEKLPYYKFFFEKRIHNHLNNATVFNNYSAREKFVKRGFNAGKIFVIHNAIDAGKFSDYKKDLKSEIRIVTVARFVEQKDFRTALYSFHNLLDRHKDKDLKYYIIGYGPLEEEIRLLAGNLKIMDRIEIFLNPPNIRDILKSCDIYLSTSLFEGLSNSLMEALAIGLPVVATDVGDNRFLIEDGVNGFLVGCKNINVTVKKLEYLVESEELRRRFGESGKAKIRNEFSEENMITNYLSLISQYNNKEKK